VQQPSPPAPVHQSPTPIQQPVPEPPKPSPPTGAFSKPNFSIR
jgi:hypothetical protein